MDEITMFKTVQPAAPQPDDTDDRLRRARARLDAAMTRQPVRPLWPGRSPRPRMLRRYLLVSSAAMAAACAALVTAVLVPSGSTGAGSAGVRTDAYVVLRHVQAAIAGKHWVLYVPWTNSGSYVGQRYVPAANHEPNVTVSYGARWRWVQMWGACDRYETGCQAGKPVYAIGTAIVHGRLAYVEVSYANHTWDGGQPAKSPSLSSACGRNALLMGSPPQIANQWPQFISATIECGAARVTGRAWVNGVHAIVVKGYPYATRLPKGLGQAARDRASYTLYVNPRTYMPLRMSASNVSYGGGARPWIDWSISNFKWLPPTKANIAKALIRIPRGYRHVKSIWG